MSDEPDLVSLLYRADWTQLSLAAGVSASRDRDLARSRFGDDAPPGAPQAGEAPEFVGPAGPAPWGPRGLWGSLGPWRPVWRRVSRSWGPWGPRVPWDEAPDIADAPEEDGPPRRRFFGGPGAGDEWEMATDQLGTEASRSTLLVMPGRRYRWHGEGLLSGCDGERSWVAVRDGGGWEVDAASDPGPPLEYMLRPSWLLTGYVLEYGGPVTTGGRDALLVVATPRPDLWPPAFLRLRPLDRVEVAVDAGLGILLRHEEILDGRTLSVTELSGADVNPSEGDFLPPGGWDAVRGDEPDTTPGSSGLGVFKLVGGLAAGGLGALIGSARFQPFEQATQEEAEAEMPASGGPPPAGGPPASAAVLHLVHASRDRWAPGITATLHQWHDVAAMLAQVPDSARRAGFGGLGLLLDTLGERMATLHMVLRLSADGSGRYRVEPALPPEPAKRSSRHQVPTIVCDGERRWEIFEDHAVTGPAKPLPSEFGELLDASWLLEHRLSGLAGGEEVTAGGRRGYRLAVTPGEPAWGAMFFTDDVAVDAELGILLRATCHAGSTPLSRYELRDVVLGEPAAGTFVADIPDGLRVDEGGHPRPGPVNVPVEVASRLARRVADDARSAVRSVLDVLRGG